VIETIRFDDGRRKAPSLANPTVKESLSSGGVTARSTAEDAGADKKLQSEEWPKKHTQLHSKNFVGRI